GIAGASAGYFLSPHGDVTLLEREDIPGYHTTGRSAAFYAPSYGGPALRPLTIESGPFLHTPPEGFSDVPLLHERGALYIARDDQRGALQNFYDELARLTPEVEMLDGAEATKRCPVLREDYVASAMFEPACHDIDVNAVHQGYLRGLRKRGGQVVTGAEVLSLTRKGGAWVVETSAGTYEAEIVINAAGAWGDVTGQLAGLAPVGLTPLRRTVITVPAPQPDISHWPLVLDVEEAFYFKPESGSILASPADETPMEPCDVQPEELDIAILIDRLQNATEIEVPRIERRWAGLRTFAPDRTPVVGFDPDAPGFFWFVGQGGYGIQTSPSMGRLAESLIIHERFPDFLGGYDISRETYAPQRFSRR
ncbi:MAG: FAD-dependent oxidoreductase, partial [Alphaproteobacteria bacterium]|nr:FAD-dependent oxidoreductase [Alphaproteobacteria bacterium]